MKLTRLCGLALSGLVSSAGVVLTGCEQTNAQGNSTVEQVSLITSFAGAAISVYRPSEAKLYVYELKQDQTIKACTAWSIPKDGMPPQLVKCR